MISAANTGNSFYRNNQELRKDIVKSTSMQQERPQTENIKQHQLSPLPNQASKRSLYEEKSGLTNERNMKFKLDQLEEKLEELLIGVRGTRDECRVIKELFSN